MNDPKGMAAAAHKTTLASLKRPGDKGTIKRTASGKFQPQLFIKELNTQRALGSCDTAEEAARAVAAALAKRKRGEEVREKPKQQRATRGMVRRPATLPLPCALVSVATAHAASNARRSTGIARRGRA